MKIEFDGEQVIIDGQKYVREPKPEEPEIEDNRLVYWWDIEDGEGNERVNAKRKYALYFKHDKIQPVHRQWNELTDDEQNRFKLLVRTRSSTESNYKDAYKLITGEDHP